MPLPAPDIYSEIYRRHGHRCPMSTLGGRLGHAARLHLPADGANQATYHIATCAVDGIAVTTGCSRESGTLHVVDCGRHALWLRNNAGSGIFAELKPQALQLSAGYRTLSQAIEQERNTLSPLALATRLAEQEDFLDRLLQQLWALPDETLIAFSRELPSDLCRR